MLKHCVQVISSYILLALFEYIRKLFYVNKLFLILVVILADRLVDW